MGRLRFWIAIAIAIAVLAVGLRAVAIRYFGPVGAIRRCDVKALEVCMADGANPSAMVWSFDGMRSGDRSLLWLAVRHNCNECIATLLAYGASVSESISRDHPILIAVKNDNETAVQSLCRAGVSPLATTPAGNLLLHEAIYTEKWHAVVAMLPYVPEPVDWDALLDKIVWRCVRHQRSDALKSFVQLGMPVDSRVRGGSLLLAVAKSGDVAGVQVLLAQGASIDFAMADLVFETPPSSERCREGVDEAAVLNLLREHGLQ